MNRIIMTIIMFVYLNFFKLYMSDCTIIISYAVKSQVVLFCDVRNHQARELLLLVQKM